MIGKAGRSRVANSASWILHGAELCLFANDAKMDEDDPFGFEEAKGYVTKRFSDVGWRWNEETSPMIGAYEPQVFRIGVKQNIYGYFIRGADGSVIHAEKFAAMFDADTGDSITIYPRIAIRV